MIEDYKWLKPKVWSESIKWNFKVALNVLSKLQISCQVLKSCSVNLLKNQMNLDLLRVNPAGWWLGLRGQKAASVNSGNGVLRGMSLHFKLTDSNAAGLNFLKSVLGQIRPKSRVCLCYLMPGSCLWFLVLEPMTSCMFSRYAHELLLFQLFFKQGFAQRKPKKCMTLFNKIYALHRRRIKRKQLNKGIFCCIFYNLVG